MNQSSWQRDDEKRCRDEKQMKHTDDDLREQMKSRDDEQRRSREDELRRSRGDELRRSRDDEPRTSRDDEPRRSRDDERRRSRDDERRRSRDDEQRRSRDDEQRRSRDDEPTRHRDDEQKKLWDDEQKRGRSDQDTASYQCKRHKDNIPSPSCNIVDKMYEMFTAPTPLPDTTSTKCSTDKNQICTTGRTWGERMDAEVKPKKVTSSDPDNLNKENNPWKKCYGKVQETDKKKLKNRQRQIDIGKGTEGYKKYMKEIERKDRTPHHPRTPDKYTVCSTRSWQGVVRIWRRKLHHWDPPEVAKEHQKKFANILASPFDNEESREEEGEEMAQQSDEDCIIEEDHQKTPKGNDLDCDENISESMLLDLCFN